MREFAPNVTPRYRIKYRSNGRTHTFNIRTARGTMRDDAGVASKLGAFLNTLKPSLPTDFALLSGTFQAQDAVFSQPMDISSHGFTGGTGTLTGAGSPDSAMQLNFVGRSETGHRVSLAILGAVQSVSAGGISSDFRITATENANVAAALTALSELSPVFTAINGDTVTWGQYCNLKYNDYYVRRLRA